MKKKILFVMCSLGCGGAERVASNVISYLNKEEYEISVAVFDKKIPFFYDISSCVPMYDLKKKSNLSFVALIFRLSALIDRIKPDVVVSLIEYSNLISIFAKILSRHKFNLVIGLRTYLKEAIRYERFCAIKLFLYKVFFRFADIIVVNSHGLKEYLNKSLLIESGKIAVVNNPVDIKKIDVLKNDNLSEECPSDYILAAGRLTRAKGYPYLLKAFSLIHEKINKKLLILGDGEERKCLEKMAVDLGIKEKVIFLGFQKNPYKFMKNASIFVLSSLWEGFPNAIIEAMACGNPIISTDCLTGPSEIITNGVNGILVPPGDVEAMSMAISSLLSDKVLMDKLSAEGRKRAEEYSVENIVPHFEEVIFKKGCVS